VEQASEFARLVSGLRAGDPACAEALCRRFAPYIRAAVRRQLHPRLRTRMDSLDLVQDVWASFLAIPTERYAFETETALVAFLTRLAQNRAVEVFRQRFETQKDDITREIAGGDDHNRYASSGPTPSQWAIAGEEWERLVNRFPAGHRAILELLREGHTNEDVARLASVSLSTVNRIVRRLRDLSGL